MPPKVVLHSGVDILAFYGEELPFTRDAPAGSGLLSPNARPACSHQTAMDMMPPGPLEKEKEGPMPPGTMLNVPRQPKPNIKIEGLDESWEELRDRLEEELRHNPLDMDNPPRREEDGPEPPPQMKWTKEFEIVDGVNPNGKNGITLLLAMRMWQVETPDMCAAARATLSPPPCPADVRARCLMRPGCCAFTAATRTRSGSCRPRPSPTSAPSSSSLVRDLT